MEYHGIRWGAGTRRPKARRPEPRRPEPSWPAVIATTLRLWAQRHPVIGTRAPRGRRAVVLLAVAAVILVGAGVAGAVLRGAGASPPAARSQASQPAAAAAPAAAAPGSAAAALGVSAATRTTAARWIAAQVAPSAIVACDPVMCAALQADGLTATSLLVLGPAASDPLGSDLVVATSAVRSEFGTRLAGVYAPSVIASFGSGAARIDVRAIAPDGAAAYRSSLAADRQSRVSAGGQLLRNPRISVTAAARTALAGGDVDPRLLELLAALAAQQPVRVNSFGDAAPGAPAGVPLRSAVLAPPGSAAQATSGLGAMLAFIQAQQQPYRPLRAAASGSSALMVEYAAPSPLGLLSGP
jgi:hypothetical protein